MRGIGIISVLFVLLSLAAARAQMPAPPTNLVASGYADLEWDPSPSTNAVGYNLYYGGASGDYTNSIYAGAATSIEVDGLTLWATYYFAVVAVDAAGDESPLSNEAVYTVPLVIITPYNVTNYTFVSISGTVCFTNLPANRFFRAAIIASSNVANWNSGSGEGDDSASSNITVTISNVQTCLWTTNVITTPPATNAP